MGEVELGELLDTWQAAIERRDLARLPRRVRERLEAPLAEGSVREAIVMMRLAILTCAAAGFVMQAWRIAKAAGFDPEWLALEDALVVRRRRTR